MIVDPKTFSLSKLPIFIVIDGVNGAGKSTLQKKIAGYFESRGLKCQVTREPGATSLGKKIRGLVLDKDIPMNETTELLLFAADRAEHVAALIKPKLLENISVISDRYYYSTVAFQGYGRGICRETIDAVNAAAVGGAYPDLLILLDLDPLAGLKRNTVSVEKTQEVTADGTADKLEFEGPEFHTRMRDGFLELARDIREPCVIINAAQSCDAVWENVRAILERSFHG